VVPHILSACLAVGPPVCLSDALLHAVASTVGAILVFPGASEMELGKSTPSPPFLTGLGWDLAVWSLAPTFAICACALVYLLLRNMIMRNEDPLHTMLWVSLPLWPDALCGHTMACQVSSSGVAPVLMHCQHQPESSIVAVTTTT